MFIENNLSLKQYTIMCNCNEGGKVINLNMGCCVPIVANADAYYTKSEIDEKIDGIVTSGCCITPEEVDEKIADATEGYVTEQWVENQGYLTEHQPLKTINNQSLVGTGNIEISATTDLSNYYNKQETNVLLNNKLDASAYTPTDLSNYATKDYVSGYTYDKQTIDEKVAGGGSFDPTQYYNKTQTNELLENKLDASAYTPTDLSNYDTKSEVNNKISSATNLVYNSLTAHTANTTIHITQTDRDNWNGKSNFSGSYNDLTDKPTIPSLNGYATEQWVENQGYLTEHQSLSAYPTTQQVNNLINASVSGKADTSTLNYVNNSLTSHTANTTVHVTQSDKDNWDSKVSVTTLNNYMLKSKIWCGTQSQFDAITVKDSETLYLIHS